jgi:predicted RNase H-like nuclease
LFYGTARAYACEFIPGASGSGLRKQVFEIVKAIGDTLDAMAEEHEDLSEADSGWSVLSDKILPPIL